MDAGQAMVVEVEQNLGQIGRFDADVAVVAADRQHTVHRRASVPYRQVNLVHQVKRPARLRRKERLVVGSHVGKVLADHGANGNQPAHAPGVEIAPRLDLPGMITEAQPHHHLLVPGGGQGDQVIDALGLVGERFLAENVAAGIDRLHGLGGCAARAVCRRRRFRAGLPDQPRTSRTA